MISLPLFLQKITDWVDDTSSKITGSVAIAFNVIINGGEKPFDNFLGDLNVGFQTVQDRINKVIVGDLHMYAVSFPVVTAANLDIKFPTDFLPKFPSFSLNALLISQDLISLRTALGPWVNRQMQIGRDVARIFMWIGVAICIFPALAVLGAFIYPFIPHSVKEFFFHPSFLSERTKKGKSTALPAVSSPSNGLEIGSPTLVSGTR